MHIKDFPRGWFIGNFDPSLWKTDVEVGLRWNDTGDKEKRHYHKRATEYIVFVDGVHRLNDREYFAGDIAIIHPWMSTDYECLLSGNVLTVKDHSLRPQFPNLPKDKYMGSVLNLVIPAAGKGQRFIDAGYTTPKPMIEIEGQFMISRVKRNFCPKGGRTLAIGRTDLAMLSIYNEQQLWLDHDTDGAVSTMLEAEHLIGREDPMIIANCDQLILNFDVEDFMKKAADCSVTVFESDVPHHSYVKEENGFVTEVAEKQVISNKAVGGVYFYRKSKYYFDNAKKMIEKNIRVNGEFYNTPVFNEIIASGLKVNAYEVPVEDQQILGTPAELQEFERKLAEGKIKL